MAVRPTSEKPSRPKPKGPTKEELLQQEFEHRVQCAVAAIIDEKHFERALLVRLGDATAKLIDAKNPDREFVDPVKTAYNDALSAMLARMERIADSDKPAYYLCSKCGE